MAATYTGAWRNQALHVDRALPPNPGVDPSHMRPDGNDRGVRAPSGGPPGDRPPLYLTETEDASYALAVDTPGQQLDSSPITHEEEISYPVPSPRHLVDMGAEDRNVTTPRIGRRFDEEYETERFEQQPIIGELPVAQERGRNSLTVNNPDGYRKGFTIWRRTNRPAFPLPGMWRVHTERALRNPTAAAAVDSPQQPVASIYTSPFSWGKKVIESHLQNPMLRRDPVDRSDALTVDGSESPDATLDWVIG